MTFLSLILDQVKRVNSRRFKVNLNETLAKKLLEIDEGSLGWGLQLPRTGTSDRQKMGEFESFEWHDVNIVYTK